MIQSGGLQFAAYQARKAYAGAAVSGVSSSSAGTIKTQEKARTSSDTFTMIRSNDADGVLIGGWGEHKSSAAVYRPAAFSDESPSYRVRVWGADGRPTTRTISVASVDPTDADEAEMLALTSWAEETGAQTGAAKTFMAARAYVKGYGGSTSERADWLGILDGAMQSEYKAGSMTGFTAFKKLWDFLSERAPLELEPIDEAAEA